MKQNKKDSFIGFKCERSFAENLRAVATERKVKVSRHIRDAVEAFGRGPATSPVVGSPGPSEPIPKGRTDGDHTTTHPQTA